MREHPQSVLDTENTVQELKEKNHYFYLQQVDRIDGQYVYCNNRKMINLASYSYLGLLHHPEIDAYAKKAIDEFGTGTHGVRILAGTIPYHNELEQTIAAFKKREDAIVYSSGYVTNLSAISTLFGRRDAVICDKYDHASIVDGCLLSGAELIRFNHNDLQNLEKRLIQTQEYRNRCVLIDSVYSMDGDIAPIPEMIQLCRKYNAIFFVDEAHSLGVLGENGTGVEEYFDCYGEIDILMGTLSKVVPSMGGYIAADKTLISHLKHRSRSFVFSAALTPANTAAATASFRVMQKEIWRVRKLKENIEYFTGVLRNKGFNLLHSQTAIIPLIIPEEEKTWQVCRYMQDHNIFVLPVVPPAVPPNTSRLRMNVSSEMTKEDMDYVIQTIFDANEAFKIL
jgi:8-amino-7-oxononanoate synthase